MSSVPDLDPPAPRGLFGALRAWLRARSSEIQASSEVAPTGFAEAAGPLDRAVRVLVVDDNPVNLMLMSALIESRGLLPVLAADGAEAVAFVIERHFDLILMDLQMPILDGFGATSAIRRFESAASRPAVPILAFSSAAPSVGVLAKHGMNGSLPKPCGDREFEDCLMTWCPPYRSAQALRMAAHDLRREQQPFAVAPQVAARCAGVERRARYGSMR